MAGSRTACPPTFREIVRDLERRGYTRARVSGSHATYELGPSSVTVCINHLGRRPVLGTYRLMCRRLGFRPGDAPSRAA